MSALYSFKLSRIFHIFGALGLFVMLFSKCQKIVALFNYYDIFFGLLEILSLKKLSVRSTLGGECRTFPLLEIP